MKLSYLSIAPTLMLTACGFATSVGLLQSAGGKVVKTIPLRADVDGDCTVTLKDLQMIRAARGKSGFDPKLDLNQDGVVDVVDSALAIAAYGKTCADLTARGSFDLYANTPNDAQLDSFGYSSISLGLNDYIFRGSYPNYDETVGYEPAVRNWANQLATKKIPFGVIDIENWGFGPAELTQTVTKFQSMLSWFQNQRSDLGLSGRDPGIGIYGNVPYQSFWAPNNYLNFKNFIDLVDQGHSIEELAALGISCPNTVDWCRSNVVPGGSGFVDYQNWQALNDRLSPLAKQADALFPSLYLYYQPSEGMLWAWLFYLRAQIQESARYHTGRPVLPYVWMQIHNSTRNFPADPREGYYLPRYVWAFLLETIYLENGSTGLVLWNDSADWDNQKTYGWWQATLEWQKFYGLGTPTP